MGLDRVVERIRADAKAERERILAEANAKADAALGEARRRREEILASHKTRGAEEMRLLMDREAARTEVETKKAMLASRKKILDEARAAVLESMKRMPPAELARYYSALLSVLGPEFAGGTIHCSRGQEQLFAGVKGMTVKGDLDAAGGFVVESRDGTLAADMKFESLLAVAWERRIAKTAAALFGGERGA